MNVPDTPFVFKYQIICLLIEKFIDILEKVKELKEQGKVGMADHLYNDVDEAIDFGLNNVGMYHLKRPLLKNKEGYIVTEDIHTLYYYHNRMDGYDLEKYL